jgi:hypothetical protein
MLEEFENKIDILGKDINGDTKTIGLGKILTIILILIIIIALIYRFINPINKSIQNIVNKNSIDKKTDNIKMLSVKDNKILILKIDGDKKEIKLINTETRVINDISQGDIKANTAKLSNSTNSIVYSSGSKNYTSLYMITMESNNSKIRKIFDSKDINYNFNTPCKKIESDYLKICQWSTIEWSPNDNKISFFVCSQNMSSLVVVDINKSIEPNIIKDSTICNDSQREHRWLNDEDIVFSSNNNLYSVSSKNNKSSKSVYGNFFK